MTNNEKIELVQNELSRLKSIESEKMMKILGERLTSDQMDTYVWVVQNDEYENIFGTWFIEEGNKLMDKWVIEHDFDELTDEYLIDTLMYSIIMFTKWFDAIGV